MLTPSQIARLYDYVILFKYQAEKLAREAANLRSLDPELKASLIKEQTRRARELKRLETALGAEIDAFERSVTVCPGPTTSPRPRTTGPRAKHKSSATGKKSKRLGAGTTGTSSSAKNANGSSAKQKPGRPRKTAPTE